MNVQIYKGSFKMLEKSGIGRAILHQEQTLEKQAIEVTDKMNRDVDIVHINTVLPNAVLTAIKAKLLGKKVIYYGHSTMEDFKNSFKGSNMIAPAFKQWIKFCYNLGDIIITPTDYSKHILDGYGMKRTVIALSNGIDTDYFSPNTSERAIFRKKYDIKEHEKVVISVGHYIERKGIIDFIEMGKRLPHIKFIWFGHTNLNIIPEHVRVAIETAPSNVIFAGYVSKEALRTAYRSADLFAFMSHEETEGIVVLEALACKIPTIVRDIPVYADWLRAGEDIHKSRTNESFYKKIECILNGTEKNLVEAGRKIAEERSVLCVGNKLKTVYRTLMPLLQTS